MRSKPQIVEYLRQRGERITLPRLAVIDALCETHSHQTTQDLQERLAAQGLALAEPTIYRVLQWLKDCAVVSQTDLGRSGTVYELLSDPPHHHLVCLQCGHVQQFADSAIDSLRDVLRQQYGFEPRIDHLAIFGVCRACQAAHETDQ